MILLFILNFCNFVCVVNLSHWALEGFDGHGEGEGVGVLIGDAAAGENGLAVVDEAVVVAEAAEDLWVDGAGGAEPFAAEVDVVDLAAGGADVDDVDGVGGDPARKRGRRALIDRQVSLPAETSFWTCSIRQRRSVFIFCHNHNQVEKKN